MRGTGGRVCGGYLFAFAPVMLHVVLMLFQEINTHSYGRLCSPLTMAHTLFHDVGGETLYTGYSIGYTVRPMHILFRPCGLTLNKRNASDRRPPLCRRIRRCACAAYESM